jgi:hypothetical protein
MDGFSDTSDIKRNFGLRAFLDQINYWIIYFKSYLLITIGSYMILMVFVGNRTDPLDSIILITTLTGMGIELAVLQGIQAVFGYISQCRDGPSCKPACFRLQLVTKILNPDCLQALFLVNYRDSESFPRYEKDTIHQNRNSGDRLQPGLPKLPELAHIANFPLGNP